MNKLQTAYAIAKHMHKSASKKAFQYTAPYYDREASDDELEAIEIEAENIFNTHESKQELKQAEEALLDWAFNKARKIAFISEMESVQIAWDNRHSTKYRQALLDMAFKMA